MSTHNTSTAPKWESAELALSLHNVDRRDETLAIRLGDKCFYPLSHLSNLINSVWRQDSFTMWPKLHLSVSEELRL